MAGAHALDPGGGPYLLGVIGDPVAHSLSPALQQPALDLLGIPATYERWHTPESEIARRIDGLRDPRVLGANATVDILATVVFGCRVPQTLVHLALPQSARVVSVRFSLFLAQVLAMLGIAATLVRSL